MIELTWISRVLGTVEGLCARFVREEITDRGFWIKGIFDFDGEGMKNKVMLTPWVLIFDNRFLNTWGHA